MSRAKWADLTGDDRPVARTLRSLAWRISLSIIAPIAWLSFLLLFLTFWAHGLSLAQEIVVGFVSVLGLLGALLLIWVTFGVGLVRRWAEW